MSIYVSSRTGRSRNTDTVTSRMDTTDSTDTTAGNNGVADICNIENIYMECIPNAVSPYAEVVDRNVHVEPLTDEISGYTKLNIQHEQNNNEWQTV